MQILYVGNGNYKHRGARYYDVGRKLVNGLIRNGHNVYFLSDRDAARTATAFGSRPFGRRQCNCIFLETCHNLSPDLILLGHADIITPASLAAARSMLPKVKVAQFNVDPIFRPATINSITRYLPHVDATFITTAGSVLKRFAQPHAVVCYMPNPVDSSIEWPCCHERSDQAHDVFWALRATAGSHVGDPRVEIPLYVEKSGKISMDYYGMNGKPEIFGADYYRAIANARMGLNISVVRTWAHTPHASGEELYLYSSDRLSHYMGSGLLTFTTRDNRLEELFVEDRELVFFATKEELLDKLLHFKQHDTQRRAIAYAGWKKSHQQLNETVVAQYIVEQTFRLNHTQTYAWPNQTY